MELSRALGSIYMHASFTNISKLLLIMMYVPRKYDSSCEMARTVLYSQDQVLGGKWSSSSRETWELLLREFDKIWSLPLLLVT